MSTDVVVIGHVGFETVKTPMGQSECLGGAAYYAAVAASLTGASVGVFASVGRDSPVNHLLALGIDVSGLLIRNGPSARFIVSYVPSFEDRNVQVSFGVANDITVEELPQQYSLASFAYITSNLPRQAASLYSGPSPTRMRNNPHTVFRPVY